MAKGRCTPEQMASCPLQTHFSDEHHWYWPKRDYTSSTARQFRELTENKEQLCRNEHNQVHATYPTPEKPSHADMLQAIAQSALRGTNEAEDQRPAVHRGHIQPHAA